ncbi:MAG: hypothetical protein O7C59_08225 [Rickettsia endosymbiont of Ixodes persulcatus]|nr:hypothetical protein [Rickettsia endosymbiont of Ixodes persulcatus]
MIDKRFVEGFEIELDDGDSGAGGGGGGATTGGGKARGEKKKVMCTGFSFSFFYGQEEFFRYCPFEKGQVS